MPPPKPPLTAVSKPDPIYPYLPFLFWSSLWQGPCQMGPSSLDSYFPKDSCVETLGVCALTDTSLTRLYTFHTNPTVQPNEYRSVYGSAVMNSSTSVAVL